MCAIFGLICKKGSVQRNTVEAALATMAHRGPDDWGLECIQLEPDWEVWLGHRRLSILDLSELAHQPMRRGKEWLIFNGEIYNEGELKTQLTSSWGFKSRSDTEVLLAGLSIHGETFVEKANGMMAFAYFNESQRSLLLSRDRLGKKPLYYHMREDFLIFSSELKPMKALGMDLEVNQEALFYYRWLGYVPGPLSVYKTVHKLEAGTNLSFEFGSSSIRLKSKNTYWDPLKGYGKRYEGSYSHAMDEVLYTLDRSVADRVHADVPLGLFLSGGIDSSLILSSLASQGFWDVKAYTVKFQDAEYDESRVAIETARRLNFPIEVLELDQSNLKRQVDRLCFYYDEPFSDSSQIPSLAISELARKFVTVVLTGDGGDEAFLGYPRYSFQNKFRKMLPLLNALPFSRNLIRRFADSKFGPSLLSSFIKRSGQADYSVNIQQKIQRLNSFMEVRNPVSIYETMMAIHQKSQVERSGVDWNVDRPLMEILKQWYPSYSWENLEGRSFAEQMAAIDLVLYLRDDVLVKVDRATMGYSLEARSPLLDYRIIELGTSLPLDFKIRGGVHKRILRDCLARRLSGGIATLPKRGFAVPIPIGQDGADSPIVAWNKQMEGMWLKSI